MIAPVAVLASILISLAFFAEKPNLFRAIVALIMGFSDLVFLMCNANL